MVGITFSPPLLPSQTVPASSGDHPVVQVIAINRADGTAISLVDALNHGASGPGNVITGRVTHQQSDGTITLETTGGLELTLHHPPEIPLTVGSTVTLRIVTNEATPQVLLLAIDGKLVTGRGPTPEPPTGVPPNALPGGGPALAPPDPGRKIQTGDDGKFVNRPPSAPLLSSIDEAALLALRDDESPLITAGPRQVLVEPVSGASVPRIATLIRPAEARPGQAPIPIGTRYIITVETIGNSGGNGNPSITNNIPSARRDQAHPSTTPQTAAPGASPPKERLQPNDQPIQTSGRAGGPTPSGAAANADHSAAATPQFSAAATTLSASPVSNQVKPAQPQPSPAETATFQALVENTQETSTVQSIDSTAAFTRQTVQIAGRTVTNPDPGTLLIETSLGLLSISLGDETSPPPGTALRLHISAVAPALGVTPKSGHILKDAADTATTIQPTNSAVRSTVKPPPVPDQTILEEVLHLLSTHGQPIPESLTQLALPMGDRFISAFIGFLFGLKPNMRGAGLDATVRQALTELGKKHLADRLDEASSMIGSSRPAQSTPDMVVTILPYLSPLTSEPMRLYRPIAPTDKDGRKRSKDSEHFVIELTLKRLGPMQFDGVVTERRLDLTLRTVTPLPEDLRAGIEQCFFSTLAAHGWAGGLAFGKATRVPLLYPASPPSSKATIGVAV